MAQPKSRFFHIAAAAITEHDIDKLELVAGRLATYFGEKIEPEVMALSENVIGVIAKKDRARAARAATGLLWATKDEAQQGVFINHIVALSHDVGAARPEKAARLLGDVARNHKIPEHYYLSVVREEIMYLEMLAANDPEKTLERLDYTTRLMDHDAREDKGGIYQFKDNLVWSCLTDIAKKAPEKALALLDKIKTGSRERDYDLIDKKAKVRVSFIKKLPPYEGVQAAHDMVIGPDYFSSHRTWAADAVWEQLEKLAISNPPLARHLFDDVISKAPEGRESYRDELAKKDRHLTWHARAKKMPGKEMAALAKLATKKL